MLHLFVDVHILFVYRGQADSERLGEPSVNNIPRDPAQKVH